MALAESTFWTNFKWILKEILKIFHSPIGVVAGLLDATRGWKCSRAWWTIWLNLPSVGLVLCMFFLYALTQYYQSEGQVQRYLVESESRCSTGTLEEVCRIRREPEFAKAFDPEYAIQPTTTNVEITDLTLRYVDLLSKKAIAIENKNRNARYRMGLAKYLSGNEKEATEIMQELADGKYGLYSQANAWVAQDLFVGAKNDPALLPKLIEQLEKAIIWSKVDYRLVISLARLYEQSNDLQKAIVVARRAESMNPEANVDLSRLYFKVKDEEGLRDSAYAVEDHFVPKLNSPEERISDRLAVANVRKYRNKLEQAVEVLSEGGRDKNGPPEIRRELSEVYRLMYNRSISTDEKEPTANLTFLENAVRTDPENPFLSEDIAKLGLLKIKPTKFLMEALASLNSKGITTSEAYNAMAINFYQKDLKKEAVLAWEKALAKNPNNLLVLNNLSLQLAKDNPEKNLERSFELINRALNLNPANPEILDTYGDIFMIAKKPRDAVNKYELAIRIDKQRLNTHKKLVQAYYDAGMEDMAKTKLKYVQMMEESERLKGNKNELK